MIFFFSVGDFCFCFVVCLWLVCRGTRSWLFVTCRYSCPELEAQFPDVSQPLQPSPSCPCSTFLLALEGNLAPHNFHAKSRAGELRTPPAAGGKRRAAGTEEEEPRGSSEGHFGTPMLLPSCSPPGFEQPCSLQGRCSARPQMMLSAHRLLSLFFLPKLPMGTTINSSDRAGSFVVSGDRRSWDCVDKSDIS